MLCSTGHHHSIPLFTFSLSLHNPYFQSSFSQKCDSESVPSFELLLGCRSESLRRRQSQREIASVFSFLPTKIRTSFHLSIVSPRSKQASPDLEIAKALRNYLSFLDHKLVFRQCIIINLTQIRNHQSWSIKPAAFSFATTATSRATPWTKPPSTKPPNARAVLVPVVPPTRETAVRHRSICDMFRPRPRDGFIVQVRLHNSIEHRCRCS